MKSQGHYGKTIRFDNEDHSIFLSDIRDTKIMNDKFGSEFYSGKYNLDSIGFTSEILRLLKAKRVLNNEYLTSQNLSDIHLIIDDSKKSLDESEMNEVTKLFFETSEEFNQLYLRFLKEVVSPLIKEEFYFQKTPTIRFHFPDQEGFNWHPRVHTDIMLGHPPSELNVWVPLTDVFGTNSMAIASLEDSISILEKFKYDFSELALKVQTDREIISICQEKMKPLKMNAGEFLIFDSRCLHATQKNKSNKTRISFDIRIILKTKYDEMPIKYRGTGRLRMPFEVGQYYSEESIK